jgi:hypothetical protein
MRKLTLVLACGLAFAAFPALAFEGCGMKAEVIASAPPPATVTETTEATKPAATASTEAPQPTITAEVPAPKPAAN